MSDLNAVEAYREMIESSIAEDHAIIDSFNEDCGCDDPDKMLDEEEEEGDEDSPLWRAMLVRKLAQTSKLVDSNQAPSPEMVQDLIRELGRWSQMSAPSVPTA